MAVFLGSNKLKYVIDVTIGYPEPEPSSLNIAALPPCKTKLFYRVYPVSGIPSDQSKREDWLNTIWTEKDDILAGFKKTGEFSELGSNNNEEIKERVLKTNFFLVISIHVFLIVLSVGLCLFWGALLRQSLVVYQYLFWYLHIPNTFYAQL